ncbi:MAG: VOC family protein [Phycisphaerales bacterium]
MAIENAIASLAVKELSAAAPWFEAVLGRNADSAPMSGVVEWRFPRGGWLQVYQLPERAGSGSATLAVTDLDVLIAHVQRLGIDTSHTTSTAKVRTLMIVDPDGNHIAFAEAFDSSMAQ